MSSTHYLLRFTLDILIFNHLLTPYFYIWWSLWILFVLFEFEFLFRLHHMLLLFDSSMTLWPFSMTYGICLWHFTSQRSCRRNKMSQLYSLVRNKYLNSKFCKSSWKGHGWSKYTKHDLLGTSDTKVSNIYESFLLSRLWMKKLIQNRQKVSMNLKNNLVFSLIN
jgi:hypothetical protein